MNLSACGAVRVDLVKADIATLTTLPSETHELYAVYAEQTENELMIFGKVKRKRGFCMQAGHVDAAIIDKKGKVLSSFGMPIIKRGRKRPGWLGANFRARVPLVVPKGAAIRLAFHGDHCYPQMTFEVTDNYAVQKP